MSPLPSFSKIALGSADELRFKVGLYEDLLRTITESGGYGNLILADCLRRLTIGVLSRYSVTHPSENAVVSEILSKDKVRLLDCPAMGDMLHEELKLTPPSGRWHLSEKPQELDLIFYVDGSSFLRESDGMLTGPPGPSKLIAKRNVSSLLYRLIDSGATERILASLLEVLKQGGAVTDLKSFDRLMEGRLKLFQFPPMGGDVEADEIMALIKWFQPWEGKVIPGLVPWAETTS